MTIDHSVLFWWHWSAYIVFQNVQNVQKKFVFCETKFSIYTRANYRATSTFLVTCIAVKTASPLGWSRVRLRETALVAPIPTLLFSLSSSLEQSNYRRPPFHAACRRPHVVSPGWRLPWLWTLSTTIDHRNVFVAVALYVGLEYRISSSSNGVILLIMSILNQTYLKTRSKICCERTVQPGDIVWSVAFTISSETIKCPFID